MVLGVIDIKADVVYILFRGHLHFYMRNQTMHDRQSNLLKRYLITICLFFALLAMGSAMAQQAVSTTRAVKTEPQKQTIKVSKVRTPTLSKELQKSLESGNTRAAIRHCGSACQHDPSSTLATGTTGGTVEYTCNSGNCACAGASDCVAMAPICQEGTIGCNDYGCTCKEGEPDGG